MERILFWVISFSLVLLIHISKSADEAEKQSLLDFFRQLNNGGHPTDPGFGWNSSSDPCFNQWKGITCNSQLSVKKVALEDLGLAGIFNANSICAVKSLSVLSIQNNGIHGEVPAEIAGCNHLTHLYINDNQFTGILPASLVRLNNLKRLFISNNNFSGELPGLAKISGLMSFLAQNNQLSGELPKLDFTNLQQFNVSSNNFSGRVPDLSGKFGVSSLFANPGLCGEPLQNTCPSSESPRAPSKRRSREWKRVLMYIGYLALALVIVLFLAFKLISRKKTIKKSIGPEKKGVTEGKTKSSSESSGYKTNASRSDYSIPSSNESSMMPPSPLVVLPNPVIRDLSFKDLLKAPAELLGRGRHGSLYKVVVEGVATLAVKRIKDWSISSQDFRKRMEKIDQVRHLNLLPVLAFFCSRQEKLVVYEYQQNGSLFNLLHGTQSDRRFDWGSRLSIAVRLAEGLAFLHKELSEDGISHGNLKSTNILMNKSMDPCISEYGLMVIDNQSHSPVGHSNGCKSMDHSQYHPTCYFKADIYNFGVILLEMLTGKLVQSNGFDLGSWVNSVVREDWTVEVFDKALMMEGASEERMLNLLQVAMKCIDPSCEARPSMGEVVKMIVNIKEEEDGSFCFET
ncbi:hypothetical protein MRB53_028486 [Persea americana]|uniref:Uncharacterized protein n=1 Tax=Persea americana TaxID=3435 RepID=A0ACC2KG11_PERAE|nr:hypothetical protein MRB53_028486 [Persea americana]